MRRLESAFRFVPALALLAAIACSSTGCAAALIAGGAVGGYALAKDMQDGQLIDNQPPKKKENKGWFGGGNSDND